ncbi:hypothetical protein ABZ502_17330 [Streptomyces abikoensis]|uniref:hypothetical protein n=1 Tax=Streptomyces abikoensis TaxID=97398 RepID=UPI0033FDA8C0
MSKQPRRDRHWRDLEIKRVKRERRISHTAAMRIVDAERVAVGPALPTAAEGGEPAPDVQRLHFIPFVLAFTVLATADRRELAQGLADQLHTLRRETTGEEYASRADVIVPARPWAPEPALPGHVAGLLLVRAWAVRPWDHAGEWEAVVTDFHAAASTWLLGREPVPVGERPAALPIGAKAAQAFAATGEFTAHTAGEHEDLPEGWGELSAARRAEVAATGGSGPSAANELEPLRLSDVVLSGPIVRGGLEKTTVTGVLRSQRERAAAIDAQLPRPYRVVDREFQGWFCSSDGLYTADRGDARGLETMTYTDLDAARGPLRPVVPPTAEESAAVRAALASAGRKAAASVLVALHRLVLQDATAQRADGGSPRNRLMAGREGSWETAAMVSLAWNVGSDLAEKPARYDETAVAELVRVVDGWVSGADQYTEVAANLASAFSAIADEAGGWTAVADRYLQRHQRVGHPDHVVEAVQNYLMSQSSTHFA